MKGRPQIEYRASCAAHEEAWPAGDEAGSVHHTHRSAILPTRDQAQRYADGSNASLARGGYSAPVYRLCEPWTVEARIVTGWISPDDAETIAAGDLGKLLDLG